MITEAEIEKLAKSLGFVQRTSKLSGWKFLDLLLFTHFNHEELSLNELAIQLKLRYQINISKQAIDKRFTQAAAEYIKSILEKALKIVIDTNLGHFPNFSELKLKDSTCFQLPEDMSEKYPGCGGNGSKAAIRIQFEYDFKTGNISDLSLHPFNEQDTTDATKTVSSIQLNEFVLRDLGYSKLSVFTKIINSGAFFLSRLKFNIKTYEKKGDDFIEVDFFKLEKYLRKTKQTFIEKQVYIGKNEKLKIRLLIELLPEQKKKERLRKNQQTAKMKGRKVGKCFKDHYGLNLFISNIDEKTIKGEELRELYKLRWQIELMFKIWKSIGEIHRIKKMKVERFECYLYAKLLWIVINWKIFWQIQIFTIQQRAIVLSAYKVFKTLKHSLYEFRQAIINGKESLQVYICGIMNINIQQFKLEKRKDKLSLQKLIASY